MTKLSSYFSDLKTKVADRSFVLPLDLLFVELRQKALELPNIIFITRQRKFFLKQNTDIRGDSDFLFLENLSFEIKDGQVIKHQTPETLYALYETKKEHAR